MSQQDGEQPKSMAELIKAEAGIRCKDCPLRHKAEARPNSLLARLWRWHTAWCPGWKAYQESLQIGLQ
jgi:hypothetical protein